MSYSNVYSTISHSLFYQQAINNQALICNLIQIESMIKHVFVHRQYKYLDTVFEHDQSYQVLTARSFTVFEECEMKLNSLIDS